MLASLNLRAQRVGRGAPPLTHDDPNSFSPPPAFGPFRVLHQIGIGVLGPVFRTYEPDRDRLVAVKVFRLDITPEQARDLATELRTLNDARLSHPSLVTPLSAGVEGTLAYRAEEYVAAESLDVAMRHYAPARFDKVCPFIAQIGAALDEAHRLGFSHGCLHPRDVFITPDLARVNGFGVATALERIGVRPPVRRPYTAPERIDGRPWSASADVFSLAALTFELLTGRRVTGPGEQTSLAPRDDDPDVARLVAEVLATALAEDPARRFESNAAFADALTAASTGTAPRKPRGRRRKTAPVGGVASAATSTSTSSMAAAMPAEESISDSETAGAAVDASLASIDVDDLAADAERSFPEASLPESPIPQSPISKSSLIDERPDPFIEDDLEVLAPAPEIDALVGIDIEPEPLGQGDRPAGEEASDLDFESLDASIEARSGEATVAKPTDPRDEDEWPDDEVPAESTRDRAWLFDDASAADEDAAEPAAAADVRHRGVIPIGRRGGAFWEAEGGALASSAQDDESIEPAREDEGSADRGGPYEDDGDLLGDALVDSAADDEARTSAGYSTPFLLPDEDGGRRRLAALPIVLGVGVGLLIGFAGGYVIGKRGVAPTAPTTETTVSTAPTDPRGKEWSESAVGDGRSKAAKPSPVAPPVPPDGPSPEPANVVRAVPPAAATKSAARPTAAPAATKPARPTRGTLNVRSTPAGVDVQVNGRSRGRTPFEMLDLPLARYTIVLRRDGYQPETQQVTLSASQPSATLDVRLRAAAATKGAPPPAKLGPAASGSGSLIVESRPVGARVQIDGRNVGATPLTIPSIAAGPHEVRLTLAGHRTWQTTVAVESGKRARVAGSLEPQ